MANFRAGPLSYLRYRYSPSQAIISRGISKGIFGGRRGWLAAFLAFGGLVQCKRLLSRRSETITVGALNPGDRMTVRIIPVQNAKQRKQLLRRR